jgi:hypothetical protein
MAKSKSMKKQTFTLILCLCVQFVNAQNNFAKLITQQQSSNFGVLSKVDASKNTLVFGLPLYYSYTYLLDSNGNMKWSHNQSLQFVRDFDFTNDHGFIAVGRTSYQSNKYGLTIIKFDSLGNVSWTKRYHHYRNSYGTDIISKSNGTFAICGGTALINGQGVKKGAVYFMVIDSIGNVVHSKRIGNDSISFGSYKMKSLGSSYVIDGDCYVNSGYPSKYFLLTIDSVGHVLKTKILDSYNTYKDRDLTVTHDNKILYAFGNQQMLPTFSLMKLDEDLNILWCENLAAGTGRLDFPSVVELPDSTYCLFGNDWQTGSIGCKLDTSGNFISGFRASYSGGDGRHVLLLGNKLLFHSITELNNFSESDLIITTDYNFNATCFVTPAYLGITPFSVADSVITMNNITQFLPVSSDSIFFIDTTLDYTLTDICAALETNETLFDSQTEIFPNPVSKTLSLLLNKAENIIIFNVIGEIVFEKNFTSKGKNEVDVSFLSRGIYFVKVGNEVRKFVKE